MIIDTVTAILKKVVLLMSLLFVSVASQAATVQGWLNKMMESSQLTNYEGSFVFWRDQKLESMRVLHGNSNGHIWVSLESLNGEPRQLIHENGEVTSIYPNKHLVSVNEMTSGLPFYPNLPKDLQQLNQHYELSLGGEDRVANRSTQIIVVKPKDQLRYGFKYWLDKETGMMLRCDVISPQQKVLEHMMFTDLQYLKSAPDLAFHQTKIPSDYKVLNQKESEQINTKNHWAAEQLPAGFSLTKNIIKPMRKKHSSVQQLVFSDGLASVSVFIDDNANKPHNLDGHTSMGSINAFGLMQNRYQITAIGEVPTATVKMIAESIRWQP